VFDAHNWLPNMRVAMEAVLATNKLCEAAICYTGDLLDPKRTKYNLDYYLSLAKELEALGAHLLAIKDMAGLCKPAAASQLIRALKDEIGIPIHFHTHDTAGIQAAAVLAAVDAGVDIVDLAMAPLSGGTSQPNLNTIVEALRGSPRETGLPTEHLDRIALYWRVAREFYVPFECPVLPASADLYRHEMPGGQFTNFYQQANALGLADRWDHICRRYADINQLFGDIVKVTPTSKAVGDMALFMVANGLSTDDVLNPDRELAFPASVVDLVAGRMGQPMEGFPRRIVDRILRGAEPLQGRPGDTLPAEDFDAASKRMEKFMKRAPTRREIVTYLLYPKVFQAFAEHRASYADVSVLPSPVFFFGLLPTEEITVDIEDGKTLVIKFLTVGDPHPDGHRTVFFELNGQPREVTVKDRSIAGDENRAIKANPDDPTHVGASIPGMVVNVAVESGDSVAKGQALLTLEAMKMESTLTAERSGCVERLLVKSGCLVEAGDLLLTIV
jgi:pyruvate carboxylase